MWDVQRSTCFTLDFLVGKVKGFLMQLDEVSDLFTGLQNQIHCNSSEVSTLLISRDRGAQLLSRQVAFYPPIIRVSASTHRSAKASQLLSRRGNVDGGGRCRDESVSPSVHQSGELGRKYRIPFREAVLDRVQSREERENRVLPGHSRWVSSCI